MKRPSNVLTRLAAAARPRRPWLSITASPWWTRVLLAAGAQPAGRAVSVVPNVAVIEQFALPDSPGQSQYAPDSSGRHQAPLRRGLTAAMTTGLVLVATSGALWVSDLLRHHTPPPTASLYTFVVGRHVYGVAFNPAGTILATADGDGTVKLWNPTTHQQIGTTITATDVAGNGVTSVVFNPAGTILAAADGDGAVRLWNPATQLQIGTTIAITNYPGSGFTRVAFNRAGTILAAAGTIPATSGSSGDDGTVRLWNPATQRQRGTTITAGRAVNSVAFNPSGTILAIAYVDGTVSLWNPAIQ